MSAESARDRRWSRSAMRRRDARRPENSAGRSVSGWARATGSARARHRLRHPPPPRARGRLLERSPRLLAQACHRRRGEPAAVPDRAGRRRRTRASRTAVRRSSARSAAASRAASSTAQPLHIGAELDERAVLVEDDQVDPVEEDRHTSSTTASVARTSSRAAPSTKHASGGNDTVTGKPTPGSDRWGSLKVSSAMTLGG